MEKEQMVSATQLCEILSISKRTVYRLLNQKKIPDPIRIGGSVRWRLSEIETWIENGCPLNENSTYQPRKRPWLKGRSKKLKVS